MPSEIAICNNGNADKLRNCGCTGFGAYFALRLPNELVLLGETTSTKDSFNEEWCNV